MMGALPQTQPAGGIASLLATLGAAPAGGEQGGFDQLLAAAPANGAASIRIDLAATIDAVPVATDGEAVAEAAAAPAEADAATDAANLLIALIGAAEGAPATTKPAAPATGSDSETPAETVAAEVTEAAAAPVVALLQAVTAVPANARPAKTPDTAAPDSAAPAMPAAVKPRAPAPAALPATEIAAAKPADAAAPSMTILFAQAETQGAATPLDLAQPAVVAERVLDMASDDLWIEQLARDIAATRSDSGDISFRLMPRHLGRLDVAMQMDGEGVSVRLDTQHEATATIVTAAQGKLVEDLRQQGVRVTGAEVTCTPGETGRQSQQGQGRGAAADASHLIETATDGADPRADRPHDERTAGRRGRFA